MSFPRYPEYKDSGVPWLGAVPEHWGVQRLKTLFNLMKRPPSEDDGIVTAFRDGEVTLRSNRRVEGFTNALQEVGYQGVRKGDLVIHAMDAFAGAIGVSDSDGKSTPVYSVCTPVSAAVSSHYYGLALRHMALSGFVNSLAKGVRERSTEFRWADASVVDLPVPPIEEQTAITRFLSRETAKIDALVAEQEQLISLLKEKRQAVISHAVTKGLDPSVPMKDSGVEWLGEVPAHWDVVRVKHLVKSFEQGWSPQCENFPVESTSDWGVLKVGCVNGGIFSPEENKALPSDLTPVPELGISAGDLLISRANTRELVGSAAVALADHHNLMLCDKLYRLRLDPGLCLPEFLSLFLGTERARGQIELAATGASSSMLNIAQSTILEMCQALPPIAEQQELLQRIEESATQLDQLVKEAVLSIELLRERRSALISAAVTGQIDVRGPSPAQAQAA